MIPRMGEGIRGRVRLPEPRKDGAAAYLKQLLLTTLPLVATDLLSLLASVSLCSLIGLRWVNPANPGAAILWFPSVALAWVLINAVLGLYPGVRLGLVDEIRRLSLALGVVALMTLARHDLSSSWFQQRVLFMSVAYCVCVFIAPIARSIVRKRLAHASWWGFPTLVCGDDSAAFNVDQWLWDNRRLGLRPVGVIADPAVLELDRESPRYLGGWGEARRLAEKEHAFWAVLVEPEQTEEVQFGMSAAIEQHLGNVPHIFLVSKLTGMPDPWNRHQMDEGLAGHFGGAAFDAAHSPTGEARHGSGNCRNCRTSLVAACSWPWRLRQNLRRPAPHFTATSAWAEGTRGLRPGSFAR